MPITREDLVKKGWTEKDIIKTINILNSAKENKSTTLKRLDFIAYWVALIVAIIINVTISIALIPVLIFIKGLALYIIIGIIGLSFGFLFDFLIREIESIGQKDYVIQGLFIPSIAIINVYYITNVANNYALKGGISLIKNPILISLVYVLSFITPYLLFKLYYKMKNVETF